MLELLDSINHIKPECVLRMKDGDIGVITEEWNNCNFFSGIIIQRCNNKLITIGRDSSETWSDLLDHGDVAQKCLVKILPPSTKFILK